MSTLGNNLFVTYYAQQETLPKEYRRVEYLESTGTQCIDTGVADIYGVIFEGRVAFTQKQANVNGAQTGNPPYYRNIPFGTFNNAWYIGSYNFVSSSSYNLNQIYNIYGDTRLGTQILKVDGNIILTSSNNNELTSLSLWLFGLKNYSIRAKERIYQAKYRIHDEQLIRNYIPCVRKSDGKPGLYDLCKSICPLTGTPFYINAGTGEFVIPT